MLHTKLVRPDVCPLQIESRLGNSHLSGTLLLYTYTIIVIQEKSEKSSEMLTYTVSFFHVDRQGVPYQLELYCQIKFASSLILSTGIEA